MELRDADKTEAASNPTFFGEMLPSSFDVISAKYLFVLVPGMNLLRRESFSSKQHYWAFSIAFGCWAVPA